MSGVDDPRPDDGDLQDLRSFARRSGAEPEELLDPPPDLWYRIAAGAGVPAGEVDAEPERAGLDPVRSRAGWRRAGPWLAAAAAAVILAVGAAVAVGSRDDATVVATAALEPLGPTGSGTAELLDDDGSLRLRVDTTGVEAGDDGFLELWVIDPDVTRLVSLGPLRADGTYDLPTSVDPRRFPVVDVSSEPADGDPTHSGDSVLRGTLEF